MRINVPVAASVASLLLAPTALADGLYPKGSAVLQVDGKSYGDLIAKSNHTSIVEFYAPWCGHCKNLQPAYEKAAKSLAGLAKVAAVNCDEEPNKPFCGSMGVQGFPTLKIVRPGKKPGRPNVEDYQGPRTAKGIVDAVKDKIPNHVKRITDKSIDEWLQESNETAKAILFSDKGTTSALLKALAVDFLGAVSVAQVRDKEKTAVATFSVTSYPSFVLLPGGQSPGLLYDGDLTKAGLTTFLSQIATPNPDPAPKKAKASKATGKDGKKASKNSSSFAKASASHEKAESAESRATQTKQTLEDEPTESPNPNVVTEDTQAPIKLPDVAPMLSSLESPETLQTACLTTKSGLCVLALLPTGETVESAALTESKSSKGLQSLSEIHHKHAQRGGKLFPFYAVPGANTKASTLRTSLSLAADSELEIVAVSGKKAWVKRFAGGDFGRDALETWVDSIRMGEGKKEDLPETLLVAATAAAQPLSSTVSSESAQSEPTLDVQMEEISDEEVERLFEQAKEDGHAAPEHSEL